MTSEIFKPTPIKSTHYSREKGVVLLFFFKESASLINTGSPSAAFIIYYPFIPNTYISTKVILSLISHLSTLFITWSFASINHQGCNHTITCHHCSHHYSSGTVSTTDLFLLCSSHCYIRTVELHRQLTLWTTLTILILQLLLWYYVLCA